MKELRLILKDRLPTIDRWKRVRVYKWDSPMLPDHVVADPGTFVIYWSGPKRKNIHPYEYKVIPLEDLEKVKERNKMRLRNETVTYK